MTFLNILLYVGLIGYVLFKKVQGQPIKAPKRLLGLPILLIVLGFGDLTSGKAMKPIEITLTVVGAALSLGLGLMRGQADKVSTRDGSPFVQWGKASLGLFAANIVAKLVLDLIGVAAGGSASTVGKSLVFTLGLTLLGEALVLLVRSGGAATLLSSPPVAGAWRADADLAGTSRPMAGRFDDVDPRTQSAPGYDIDDATERPAPVPVGVSSNGETARRPGSVHDGVGRLRPEAGQPNAGSADVAAAARSLVDALAEHHSHHHDHRHDHKHDHDHRHGRDGA